jgi:hypothetical protein
MPSGFQPQSSRTARSSSVTRTWGAAGGRGHLEEVVVGVLDELVGELELGYAAQTVAADPAQEGDHHLLSIPQGHLERPGVEYDAAVPCRQRVSVVPSKGPGGIAVEGEQGLLVGHRIGIGHGIVHVGLGLVAAQQVVPLLGALVFPQLRIADGAAGGEVDEGGHGQVAVSRPLAKVEDRLDALVEHRVAFIIGEDLAVLVLLVDRNDGPLQKVVAHRRRGQIEGPVVGIAVYGVVDVAKAQLDVAAGEIVAVVSQVGIRPLGEVHVLDDGIVRCALGALVDDRILLEDHVSEGVGAGVAPESNLRLQADGLGAVERCARAYIQVVDDEPGHLVGVGQAGFVPGRIRIAVGVELGRVDPVPVPVVERRAPVGRPFPPVQVVLVAQSLQVILRHVAQPLVEEFGGVQSQVGGPVVASDAVYPHTWIAGVVGHPFGKDAARHRANFIGLPPYAQFLGVAVQDPAAPDEAVLEDDVVGGAWKVHPGVVVQGIAGGPAVPFEPKRHVVDVEQRALPKGNVLGNLRSRKWAIGGAAFERTGQGPQEQRRRERVDELLHRMIPFILISEHGFTEISPC